ncbi:MAG: GLPGLI family protein [Bacteroidota bacterium]
MKPTINLLVTVVLFCCQFSAIAQITSGRIVYERKTNLHKKYTDAETQKYLPEKIKIELFNLYFTDSASYFAVQANDQKDATYWATSRDQVYQDLSAHRRFTVKSVFGSSFNLSDSLRTRTWKIVPGTRKICGYECQKAIWQANDTTRIYAWFANEIIPSLGPESFNGLPGMILGLAEEDGKVIYFAKQVITEPVDPAVVQPKKPDSKARSTQEAKVTLLKQFSREPSVDKMIHELFDIW